MYAYQSYANMNNNQLDFLDVVNILSFIVSIMNLNENLTQNDKQELIEDLNTVTQKLLKEVHAHLQQQDIKLDIINNKLEEIKKCLNISEIK